MKLSLLAIAVATVSSVEGTMEAAWKNHFDAFGGQNVSQILLDYTNASEIRVYSTKDESLQVFEGISGAKTLFTSLFEKMTDLSTLKAPLEQVDADGNMVLLGWECPSSGYESATDTFYFEGDKILRQNVVVYDSSSDVASNKTQGGSSSGIVKAAWDNHFAAFGDKDVDKILLDYTDSSIINVYDAKTEQVETYEGVEGARTLFTKLFSDLNDMSTLKAPVIEVQDAPGNMVFLVWECPSSGFEKVTDTFLFNGNKIERQNVVVFSKDDPVDPVDPIEPSTTGAASSSQQLSLVVFAMSMLFSMVH